MSTKHSRTRKEADDETMQLNISIREDQRKMIDLLRESGYIHSVSEFARNAIDHEISNRLQSMIISCLANPDENNQKARENVESLSKFIGIDAVPTIQEIIKDIKEKLAEYRSKTK
jgi:hypothetical protein